MLASLDLSIAYACLLALSMALIVGAAHALSSALAALALSLEEAAARAMAARAHAEPASGVPPEMTRERHAAPAFAT